MKAQFAHAMMELRLEPKFCEYTAKTIISLHENACGRIKFAHNFANKSLKPTREG